jgi:WD40 repeat protein
LISLAFTCHEASGGQCLAYSQSYQLLISGGKQGDICIFDLRQRKRLATSQAHDSHLKALCLDPLEKFYITGSTKGNIKVTNFILLSYFKARIFSLGLAFTRLRISSLLLW